MTNPVEVPAVAGSLAVVPVTGAYWRKHCWWWQLYWLSQAEKAIVAAAAQHGAWLAIKSGRRPPHTDPAEIEKNVNGLGKIRSGQVRLQLAHQ